MSGHSYASVVDRIYSRKSSELYDNIAYLHHPSGVTVVVLRNVRFFWKAHLKAHTDLTPEKFGEKFEYSIKTGLVRFDTCRFTKICELHTEKCEFICFAKNTFYKENFFIICIENNSKCLDSWKWSCRSGFWNDEEARRRSFNKSSFWKRKKSG